MTIASPNTRAPGFHAGPSLGLLVPALIVGVGTTLPAAYLLLRALGADPATLAEILLRPRLLLLLRNTLALVAVVLTLATIIALPLAWLTTRSDIKFPKLVTILAALPLAIPGYVMAYALLGLSGYYGFVRHWFGISLPPLQGLWGAGLALSLYTFPYVFLNLRSAFLGMDPSLEEAAQSLGHSPAKIARQIILPQLWPALLASWLIIGLYVIGDFGAIALMRYEVFSLAIYTQYSGAFDRTYAAWLSLILLAITIAALWGQGALSRNRRFARTGTGTPRPARKVALGPWAGLAWLWVGLVALVSLGLPFMVLGHWMRLGLPAMDWSQLAHAALQTALLAAPVALCAVALALPVVQLSIRHPGRLASLTDRLAHLGYATPSLAFALAMVMFVLQVVPSLYQSRIVLIFALTMSFLALAFGPIRLALLQLGTRQEESARALGASSWRILTEVTLPQLRRPMIAGGLLVFVMVVKELPISYILAPTGVTTLSMTIFARTNEGMMREAAPYALSLILFSSLFVSLILTYEGRGASDPRKTSR